MEKHTVGPIDLKAIQHFLETRGVGDDESLILTPNVYDEVLIQFRRQSGESAEMPFRYFEVTIYADRSRMLNSIQIGVLSNAELQGYGYY